MRLLPVSALAVALLGACAASGDPAEVYTSKAQASQPPPPLTGGAPQANPPDVLARVAGAPVTSGDLFARLLHRESPTVFDTLDRMVTARLALLEAGRLGVVLDPAAVDREVAADMASMRSVLEKAGLETERYLREELGLDPGRYFDLMRDEVVERMMTERVMRAWILAQPRVVLRVIATEDEAACAAAKARIEAGESFADVASDVSIDPSALEGGRLPPMVRSEYSPISRLAFQTPVGELGGPMGMDRGFVLIQPVEVLPAETGGWAVVGERVEADLEATPPVDAEYWQWRAAMGRRYEVDMTPLLELAGEPLLPQDA